VGSFGNGSGTGSSSAGNVSFGGANTRTGYSSANPSLLIQGTNT
jgi:hypothetical protein